MYKYVKDSSGRYFVSIANRSEIMEALTRFCTETGIFSGKVGGIGAVKEATLRFYDPGTRKYVDKTFSEQMEIADLTGNISRKDGKVYLHVHVTLGRSDYSCIGGHLLSAVLNGACELFVEPFGAEIGRYPDEDTGLNLPLI